MSTKDDALIEKMMDAAYGKASQPLPPMVVEMMRTAIENALAVARKAILEEAAGMVEREYDGACYEGISRHISADIRSLANQEQPQ